MYKLAFLFIVLIGICSCKSSPKIPKETIVRTLNEIIASDSFTFNYVSAHLDRLDIPDSLVDKFFKNDGDFIRSQQNDTTNLSLYGARILTYSRGSEQFEPASIDSSFMGSSYNEFSKPIFSSDGQTVAVSITQVCNGLCGWGKKIIYRKEHGFWKRVAIWDSWIS